MAKVLIGQVTSDKPDKTIVVSIQTRKTHPLYKKQYTLTRKFMAHDEKNEAKAGDKVSISEVRPLSARKRYSLLKIIERPIISQEQTVEAITKEEVEQVAENEKVKPKETVKPKTEKTKPKEKVEK